MDRTLCVALAVVWLTSLPGLAEDSASGASEKNIGNLQFQGCEPSVATSIRRALFAYGPVQKTLHDNRATKDYLDAVCEAVERGYRFHGYYHVNVSADESGDGPVIVIETGDPVFRGAVRILGDEQFDREQLIERLTTPHLLDAQASEPAVFWNPKKTVSYSEHLTRHCHDAVGFALQAMGYGFAEFDVHIVPDAAPNRMALEVTIHDDGGRQQFSGVQFTGLTRHTEDDLLSRLQLPDQLSADPELLSGITRRLLDTGRFLTVKTLAETPFDADHVVPLTIDVVEYEDAPLLSESHSEIDAALVRLAGWLETWPEQEEDCHISADIAFTEPGKPLSPEPASMSIGGFSVPMCQLRRARFEVTLSNRNGVIVDVRLFADDDIPVQDMSVVVTTDETVLVSRKSGTIWLASALGRGVKLAFALQGQDPANAKRRFQMSSSAGITTDAVRPVELKIAANPAAVVGFAKSEAEPSVQPTRLANGMLLVKIEGGTVEIDPTTGRLVRMVIQREGIDVIVRTERGLFEQRRQHLSRSTDGWANHFDADRAMESMVEFVAAEYARLMLPDDASAKLVLRLLASESAVDHCCRIWTGTWLQPPFSIPPETVESAVPNGDMSGIHIVTAFLPANTVETQFLQVWAQAIETGNVSALKSTYGEFLEMVASDTDGPLINFIAGSLTTKHARAFGLRGMARLNRDELPQSVQSVLDESCLLGDIIRNGVKTLRELDDDEVTLLKQIVSSQGEALQMTFAIEFEVPPAVLLAVIDGVRAHSSDDSSVVARDVLMLAWKLHLYDMAKLHLEQMASQSSQSVFRTGAYRKELPESGESRRSDPFAPIEIPDLSESFFGDD